MLTKDNILIGQILVEEKIITPKQLEAGPSGKRGEVKVNFILASPFPAFPKELNKPQEAFKISLRYE